MIIAYASDKFYPNVNAPRVIVPFANAETQPGILEATKLNLTSQGMYPRYIDLTNNNDPSHAYWRLIQELWKENKPFVIVEHDILPWPGALQQIWECEEPWCAFRYTVLGVFAAYLGCVKFDPEKLGPCPLPSEPVDWRKLDLPMVTELGRRGIRGHIHNPPVCHLNYGHQMMTRSIRIQGQ